MTLAILGGGGVRGASGADMMRARRGSLGIRPFRMIVRGVFQGARQWGLLWKVSVAGRARPALEALTFEHTPEHRRSGLIF